MPQLAVWFHGDALDLRADKIQNIIGFKCHNCLNKRPPVCPHPYPTGSSKGDFVSENDAEAECNVEDSNGFPHPDDRSADRKSRSNDEPMDILLTVNIEKQSSGSMPKSDKHVDLKFNKKIILGNDSVEQGGSKEKVPKYVENESAISKSDVVVKEAEFSPLVHNLVNDLTNRGSGICSKESSF